MPEAGCIKIRAELSIQAIQHVQVECCCNPGSVIVCGNESRFFFHHIRPSQQRITAFATASLDFEESSAPVQARRCQCSNQCILSVVPSNGSSCGGCVT